ncbi:MAG: S9 family peptidase [Rhizobiaceae bacterium]
MTFDTSNLTPPIADKIATSDTHHTIERTDNYGWLRADNWQEVMRDPSVLNDKIRDYLEAENSYQAALMEDTKSLQKDLFAEMKGRIKQDDSSVPMVDGDWAYGVSYVEGGEQPRFVREPAAGGEQQMLFDGDEASKDKGYFRIGGCGHAPNHETLYWSCDTKGSEYFDVYFKSMSDGSALSDTLSDTGGGGVWSSNSASFLYGKLDENHRPSKIFHHKMGSDQADDRLIFDEKDPGFFMGVGKTQSGNYFMIDIHDHETSECWLIPADAPDTKPRLIAARETGVEYSVDEGNGILYILTNKDGAEDFKIVTAPTDNPGPENWQDLIPHKSGRMIINHCIFERYLAWLERENGLPRIVVRKLENGEEFSIELDEEAYSLGLGGAYEFDTNIIRFTYSSMTTPSQTFDFNMDTRERTLLKTQEVPSGHDPADYVTRRVFAPSHDGEQIPVTLLYCKDTPLDGSAPCLLYGYGSYGMSMPASFNTNCLSLADHGFVYAIAHIRGGKEKGFAWYEAGKRKHKTNTFKDFISSANYLISEKFTSKGKIVAHGGSAGGMLMGAISNMEPDLFAGIIAEVPFVDVLTTMLDDTLPLTPPEWPEWGNPIESKEDYETIAAYSPYDRVSAQGYPPILAIGGLTDPRVTYWEPAKWVAKLRELKTNDNPVLLKTNMDAGHGGSAGRFQRLEEIAFSYSFAIKTAGLM